VSVLRQVPTAPPPHGHSPSGHGAQAGSFRDSLACNGAVAHALRYASADRKLSDANLCAETRTPTHWPSDESPQAPRVAAAPGAGRPHPTQEAVALGRTVLYTALLLAVAGAVSSRSQPLT
jgi:hypothetical protein